MGSLFGGGTTNTSSTSSSAPWGPQQAPLQSIFAGAQANEAQQAATGPYQGQYVAPMNQTQATGAGQASDYANNVGANLANTAASTAGQLQGNAGLFDQNAATMAANGTPGANQGVLNNLNSYASGGGMAGVTPVNAGLSSALNNAATSGANSIAQYNAGIGNVMNTAAGNPTNQIAANAGTYMNSAPVQQAINSTNAQIGQTLNEQTLPGLNQQAAMGGSLNSSRAGMANAMAQEGAGIAEGNADSSILNNAYNQGLNTASNQYTSGLNTSLAAANSGLSGNTNLAQGNQNEQLNSQLGTAASQTAAATAGLNGALNANALDANTRLAANNQLGAGVNTGINAGASSGQLESNNFALNSGAGSTLQAGQQAADNNALATYQGSNNYGTNILGQELGLVGGNYGGTSSSSGTSTQPPNVLGGIAGLGLGAAGLFGTGSVGSALSSGYNALTGLFGSATPSISGNTIMSAYG